MPAQNFKIVKVQPGKVIYKGKPVYLDNLTNEKAIALHKDGCPYIELTSSKDTSTDKK